MKRAVWIVLAALLLGGCLAFPTRAADAGELFDEQLEASGATSLYDALPPHTRRLMETLGIEALSVEAFASLQPQTVLSSLWELIGNEASGPLSAVASLLVLTLLVGLYSSLQAPNAPLSALFRMLAVTAALLPLFVPLWNTVQRVTAASESAAVFSLGFAPVYASALASSGMTLSAVSHQTLMLAASQTISLLTQSVVMPLAAVSLALSFSGAVADGSRLSQAGVFVNKTASWLLGIALTVFVGLLSLQGVLTASADSVGGRVMRFSVAGMVPIVGGSLAEALYTVRGCLSALKGTIGAFGVFSSVLIVLPPLIECVLWNLLLHAARLLAELCSFGELAAAAETARGIVRTLLAVLCSCALLMIVAVTLTTMVTGGG